MKRGGKVARETMIFKEEFPDPSIVLSLRCRVTHNKILSVPFHLFVAFFVQN